MGGVFQHTNTVPVVAKLSGYNRYICWGLFIPELSFFNNPPSPAPSSKTHHAGGHAGISFHVKFRMRTAPSFEMPGPTRG